MRPAHLLSLTGLRFFAALLVVLLHFSQRFDGIPGLTTVAALGYTGVTFFFVLSGFVLAWTHQRDDTAGRFYWRRFARVWPLHALTTAIAIAVELALGMPQPWFALPAVLTLTQAWLPIEASTFAFNAPSWSLSCELFFYLLFPLLIRPLGRLRRPIRASAVVFAALVAVGLACAFLLPREQLALVLYTLPPYRLGEFVIGVLLAIAVRRGWRPRFTLARAVIVTTLLYVVIVTASTVILESPRRLPYFIADLWMLPGFAAVIAAGAVGDLEGRGGMLRSTPMVRLGQWSFALYLMHVPVVQIAERIVGEPGAAATTALLLVVVSVAVTASGLLHECFERPVERRLRRMASKSPPPQPSVSA
ncbi:peptidoglycan/LPS O-acetylase OafA/YrhL [Agrococcus sp. UYP33]